MQMQISTEHQKVQTNTYQKPQQYVYHLYQLCHASLSPVPSVSTGPERRMMVLLLLLMSGDIETNPGPVGEYTSWRLLVFSWRPTHTFSWSTPGRCQFSWPSFAVEHCSVAVISTKILNYLQLINLFLAFLMTSQPSEVTKQYINLMWPNIFDQMCGNWNLQACQNNRVKLT